MTKEIQLTQGKVALVDDDDYEYLNQWKWYFEKGYALTHEKGKGASRKKIPMHRLIMKTEENFVVDHINHNTIDNRKSNLRNTTTRQNQKNKRGSNILGIKGVYPSGKKFTAQFMSDGVRYYLGTFETKEDATEKVRNYRKEKHGEFYCEE